MKDRSLKELLLEPVSQLEPNSIRSTEILAYFDRYSRTRHRRVSWLICMAYCGVCTYGIFSASRPGWPQPLEAVSLIVVYALMILATRRELRKSDALSIPERLRRSAQHEVALLLGGFAMIALGMGVFALKASRVKFQMPPVVVLGAMSLVTIPVLAVAIRWISRAGAKLWDPHFWE